MTHLPDPTRGPASRPSRLHQIGRAFVLTAATLFFIQLLFAVTGPPRSLERWLEGEGLEPRDTPRFVVVLGGGGIPSESGLIRTWHAAHFGQGLTNTTFIVSLPADESPETNSVGRMRDELVMHGIPASAIQLESRGLDTHQQAANIRQMLGDHALDQPLLVVTSGYHLRRAVLTFRKAGFTRVAGLHAFSVGAEADPGPWAWLRYNLWRNLESETRIARELIALLAYRLKGWA